MLASRRRLSSPIPTWSMRFAGCSRRRDAGSSSPKVQGLGRYIARNGLRKAYETVGYAEVAEDLGVELNYDVEYEEVPNPQGTKIKRFLIIKPAMHVDAIVSVSKLKTHLFTYLTGGTKNLFGLIPGLEGHLPRTPSRARRFRGDAS